jgi:putative spermidine/putrescine transport system ATP-binding protein
MASVISAGAHRIGEAVSIRRLSKRYGNYAALNNISLEIAAGEFMTLLGPSGSGKTTALMAIAGFVGDYEGEIWVGNSPIDSLPAHKRNIGVLFQQLALFPHMDVVDNIAFPLRMRSIARGQIEERVRRVLDLVQMSGFEHRLPAQLSGGQQQRVALARALIFNPPVLLLDEPLGALDRKLREEMQIELTSIHDRLGLTIIHVTHDQVEAMAISDRIGVIRGGRLEQCGTPWDLYTSPVNRFVANFVGESVMIEGTVEAVDGATCHVRTRGGLSCVVRRNGALAVNQAISLMIRPERFQLGSEPASSGNSMRGQIRKATFSGDRIRYEIALSAADIITVSVANHGEVIPAGPGTSPIWVLWNLNDAVAYAVSN